MSIGKHTGLDFLVQLQFFCVCFILFYFLFSTILERYRLRKSEREGARTCL